VVTDQRFSRPPHSTALPFLRRKDNIFLFFENYSEKLSKYQIYNNIQFLLTGCEQILWILVLKMKSSEQLRHSDQRMILIQKNSYFDLKVALFVEKRENKFVYELKKNKFAFN
jgi:hypothetical protein